jgi:hypothetical protein
MYVVAAVNTCSNVITLDKPLEFNVHVDSTSDGSSKISGSSGSKNKSKVVPLTTTVQGIGGLAHFYMTQIVPGHDASEATFNYNNIVKKQDMHGVVFMWAVNCYSKEVRTYMTGSHPIITEMAKSLQFKGNHLEGAWNKGKGGNGSFCNSKLWDSLIVRTTTKGLRHLTLQWLASGNVSRENALDSDINLHDGWEWNNLVKQNVVNAPYDHRDCSPSCTAQVSTWYYPIW